MADYTYRISASGTATGADAGFTTINAAVADFVGNNRMGAGTGIVAASSTLYFKIDGWLAIDASVTGIDTTTNSGAAIVVEHFADAWNATAGRIGYQTSFDGLDLGAFNQAFFGTSGSRQANLTVRNLVFRGSGVGYTSPLAANGPATGAISVLLENLFICCNHATQAEGPALDAANMRNCVVFFPNGGGDGVVSVGRASANAIENCTFVALAAMLRFTSNQNDPMPLVKNSYIGLGTSSFQNSGTWSSSCTGNGTDQASGATNWTSTVTSVAVSTTNFENVTNSTEDFRVKSTSALATTGATRLASTLTDVFAVSRQDPTTIGAHEALTGGGGGGSSAGAAAHYYRQLQG